jgi:methionine aminopeptidase
MDLVSYTKYNVAAKICGKVYNILKENITSGNLLSVRTLETLGNETIEKECKQVYKSLKNKGIAFPISISLNNCVSNYTYEQNNDEYNVIKHGDVVKIELGVNIDNCIAILGETIIYNENKKEDNEMEDNKNMKYIEFLNKLQKDIVKIIKHGETNDEIKTYIESKCTELECFPVENTISYQHFDGKLSTDESKYIITNYKKYYDEEDMLISKENLCFEFEKDEVYTINLTIIQNNSESETEHHYIQPHQPHIYRFNEYFYNLKLASSKAFCSLIHEQYQKNAFDCILYKDKPRYKFGIKESLERGILIQYPILYSKDKNIVFHKKFTIVVTQNGCNILRY